jgi:hypothetical protein
MRASTPSFAISYRPAARAMRRSMRSRISEHLDLDRVRCQRGQAILVRFARGLSVLECRHSFYQDRLPPVPVPITVAVDGSDPEARGAAV